MRPAQFTFSAASTTAIAAAQTTAGATALVLSGALVPAIQPGLRAQAQLGNGINRTISYSSTGDLSGINIVAVGLDANGAVVTSTRAGPNNSTVETTELFNRVISVTPASALGTAMSVGTGTSGATNWYAVDYLQSPISVGLWLQIAATLSATVQLTPDPFIQTTTAPHAFAHAYLTAVTADAASELPYGARGVRALINSSSGSGALVFSIIQAGAGVP